MKKIFTILLMMPLLWACSSSDNDNYSVSPDELLGSWISTRIYIDIDINNKDIADEAKEEWDDEGETTILEFNKNGKVTLTDLENGYNEEADYYLSGNELVTSIGMVKTTMNIKIKGSRLTIQKDVKKGFIDDLREEGFDTSNIKIKKAVINGEFKRL